jgi:hypothetical protein
VGLPSIDDGYREKVSSVNVFGDGRLNLQAGNLDPFVGILGLHQCSELE